MAQFALKNGDGHGMYGNSSPIEDTCQKICQPLESRHKTNGLIIFQVLAMIAALSTEVHQPQMFGTDCTPVWYRTDSAWILHGIEDFININWIIMGFNKPNWIIKSFAGSKTAESIQEQSNGNGKMTIEWSTKPSQIHIFPTRRSLLAMCSALDASHNKLKGKQRHSRHNNV